MSKLLKLARAAQARYEAMTPEQKAEHDEAQKQSFIRAFGPCEHGDYDWETCPQCLEKYRR